MKNVNPNFEKNLEKMPERSMAREMELIGIERRAVANFTGDLGDLTAALGFLKMGEYFGWRVLVLIHNKRTIRKYEEILDIEIRSFFPEEGPIAERSIGYLFAKRVGQFWKAVSGDVKIEQRREIGDVAQG